MRTERSDRTTCPFLPLCSTTRGGIHRPHGLRTAGVCLLLLWPVSVALAEERKSAYLRGLAESNTILGTTQADIDGDGERDSLVMYRETDEAIDQQGGLIALKRSGIEPKVLWHAQFEKHFPTKVSVEGAALHLELVHRLPEGKEERLKKTLLRGKDFFLLGDAQSPFHGVRIKATSTAKRDGLSAAQVFDRDLNTAWAEGAEGTGVDESLSFVFARPLDLAAIGVLPGNFKSKRNWFGNNRVHRAGVTLETASDRFDAESEVDFGEDLGLGLYGDRVELTFRDRPNMQYTRVTKKKVVSLEFKITSVLLGDKNDDAYIAEIDLVELISDAALRGESPPPPKEPKEPKESKEPKEPKEPASKREENKKAEDIDDF